MTNRAVCASKPSGSQRLRDTTLAPHFPIAAPQSVIRYLASRRCEPIGCSKIAVLDPRATSRRSLASQFESSIDQLETGELGAADERIVVPRPAVLVEQHAHLRVLELESRLAEPAVLIEVVTGARQTGGPLDGALGDKMCDLGEVGARPGEPRRERFRPCLVSPLDAPQPAAPVPR